MKKVAVIGHFAHGLKYLDGQTVKTKTIAYELTKMYKDKDIVSFDTHGGAKTLIKAPWYVIKSLRCAKNVIILPAHNGLRVFGRLLPLFKKVFRKRKIFYIVIGGWLPRKLKQEQSLARALKKFDGIFVETNTMKDALINLGFANVSVIPNFKELSILAEDKLVYPKEVPYKLCTFSRVMKEKGIETAIDTIMRVNEELGYRAYSLDIYGQIDPEQVEWFDNLMTKTNDSAKYCGCVEANNSVAVLKNYFALIFPTHYFTEGIPGTIIDAYAAGIPVISAKWESFADVIDDGVTGMGYEFDNSADLQQKLISIASNPSVIYSMKRNCLQKSICYSPKVAMQILIDSLN